MTYYDFGYFLDTVKHLDYDDIMLATKQQLAKVTEKGKKGEVLNYGGKLKGFLFWLKTGKKPYNFYKNEFVQLKSICENLVAKKQLKSSTLALFKKAWEEDKKRAA